MAAARSIRAGGARTSPSATRPSPLTGPGKVSTAVRAVQGLDAIQLQGSGLAPDTTYAVSARHDHDRLPLLSFTTDAKGGLAQALAFTKFLGVHTLTSVQARPGSSVHQRPRSGSR